jgi:hypothetical protein
MRAVVLPAPSLSPHALQLRQVPITPPKGREVLVKVAACAVAYRDVLDRKGAFPFIKQPTVLGHEFAGVVAAVGPDSREFQVGQRVVSLHWAQRDAWPSPLKVNTGFLFVLLAVCPFHCLCIALAAQAARRGTPPSTQCSDSCVTGDTQSTNASSSFFFSPIIASFFFISIA